MNPVQLVSTICYIKDIETRNELAANIITSERDYMSVLSGRIRDAWKQIGLHAYVYSKTLEGTQEQTLGCDTIIVLRDGDSAKICLIEAKLPRLISRHGHKWDKLQKSSKGSKIKISHFSSQLQRQSLILPEVAVWEMFLMESRPGTPSYLLDLYGSTCIEHTYMRNFDALYRNSANPWTNSNLWELLGSVQKQPKSLKSFIYRVASCQWGLALPIVHDQVRLSASINARDVRIPVSIDQVDSTPREFCEQFGVSNLLILELESLG